MLSYAGFHCLFCNSLLKESGLKPSKVTVYSHKGSYTIQHVIKCCKTVDCRTYYHFSYFTKHKVYYKGNKIAKFFDDDTIQKPFFMASACTAFEMEFLRSFYSDMFLCPEYSFYQKAMNFNINVATGNYMLNHKRFTEAFFQLALLELRLFFEKDLKLSTLPLSHDLDSNISDMTPLLKDLFQRCYSEHHCDVKGCRSVIGFDADCKVS